MQTLQLTRESTEVWIYGDHVLAFVFACVNEVRDETRVNDEEHAAQGNLQQM
jgi:hypothetical protein